MSNSSGSLSLVEAARESSWTTSLDSFPPLLTSASCARAMSLLLRDRELLTLATEASSHPAGVDALLYQPYVYGGGGLGNIDECPLQTCVAGAGTRRDSINFASACLPYQCSAYDVAADDFNATLVRAASAPAPSNGTGGGDGWPIDRAQALRVEYSALLERINEINAFLGTGWTCGAFQVPWNPWPWGAAFMLATAVLSGCGCVATLTARRKCHLRLQQKHVIDKMHDYGSFMPCHIQHQEDETSPRCVAEMIGLCTDVDGDNHGHTPTGGSRGTNSETSFLHLPTVHKTDDHNDQTQSQESLFLTVFDASRHLDRLLRRAATETACLDGLRVLSTLWIMFGHVMAIMSTSGAAFSNPASFLPPHGITTTVPGQLIFSSRFAVDTFLTISGYLMVVALDARLPLHDGSLSRSKSAVRRFAQSLPALFLMRVIRIMPVYLLTLGFYTQIAPHLGSGPFWYQWLALLKPCHDFAWTNFLFINNFVPQDTPTTDTCFYWSWYLAVDMQLFLLAPLLVFIYQTNPSRGRRCVLALFGTSVITTAYLTYKRQWSCNTFDGASVARFDIEAYAKPHVRAQSYLTGMFLAMVLTKESLTQARPWTRMHQIVIISVLITLAFIAFIPATGAYARRPCAYHESPQLDQCGSIWPSYYTFLYTAFSRTIWAVCIAALMHLSLGRRHFIASVLSWKVWTPLSHLSFAAYLIHPIVIFIWQLSNTSKQVFRLENFGMDFLSISTVTYAFALLAFLLVEQPCASFFRTFMSSRHP